MNQNEKVLQYMQQNGSITTWEAISHLRITRLSARIKDLRDAGVHISGALHTNQETGDRWKEYWLA